MSKAHIRAQERQQQRSQENAQHQQAQQAAFTQSGKPSKEYLESLTDHDLDENTLDTLQNLLSKDFVLGNLEEAEKDELKWLFRSVKRRVVAMHPPEESYVQGDYRKFLHDDPSDGFQSLSDAEKEGIWHIIVGVHARVTRSVEGWQQEEFGKVYAVSERREGDDDGGLGGLFPGRNK
jgi:hypothetical protein